MMLKFWKKFETVNINGVDYLAEPSVLIHFHSICIYASKMKQKKESFFQHPSSAGRPPTGVWP